MGGEISTKNWKNEHGFIRWYFHVGSWTNMFQSILRSISWDSYENVFLQSRVKEWVSWSSMKEKVLKFVEKMLWVEKTSEKFEFSYLENFSHYTNSDGMLNLEKLKLNPLFSQKSQVNSHS